MLNSSAALTLAALVAAAPLASQSPRQFRDLVGLRDATRYVATGDFDGDGDLDVVASRLSELTLLDNDGTGVFTASTIMPAGPANAIAALDADGDGDLDVAVLLTNGTVLLRNAGGAFSSESIDPVAILSSAMTPIDVDADGDLDLVFAPLLSALVVYENDGGGVFRQAFGVLPAAPFASSIATGDVNGDGHVDMFLGSVQQQYLLLGTATGFVNQSSLVSGLPRVDAPLLVDVDGDHDLDLVGLAGGQGVTVFTGDGTGAFSPASALPGVPVGATRLVIGDLDGDGDPDLVGTDLGSVNTPLATLLFNDGTGRFVDETARRYGTTEAAGNIAAIGDFDGDRDLDVYVGSAVFGFGAADDRLLVNREIDLRVDASVSTGSQLRIDAAREPGYGSGLFLGLVAVGIESPPTLTPFGPVVLDPAAVALPPIPMPQPGEGTLFETVPGDPRLVGLDFVVQALTLEVLGRADPRLTGFQRVRIR